MGVNVFDSYLKNQPKVQSVLSSMAIKFASPESPTVPASFSLLLLVASYVYHDTKAQDDKSDGEVHKKYNFTKKLGK